MRIRQRKRTDTGAQKETDSVTVKEEPPEYNQDEEDDRLPISQFLPSREILSNSSPSTEPQVTYVAPVDGSAPIEERGREPKAQKPISRVKAVSNKLVESTGRKRKKREVQKVSPSFEAQCSVLMERAKELQAKLSPEFPSFIRLMSRSHVTRGFWLGLPPEFCKSHLPKFSKIVILEDESGKEYEVNLIGERGALSAGWRRYSCDHKLLEGDVIIFHLIKPDRFKVYTVRADEACVTETGTGPVAADSEDFGSVAADFEDFKISVNGLVVNTELSRELRLSYHKLCCSQKSYLHSNLIKSIDESAVAARIIFKTVHIANAIKSCNFSTSQHDLARWDKTLKGFEELGMEVGFLRQRINRLVSLALDETAESKRYQEARDEQDRAEKKMKSLELDLLELKKSCRVLKGEIKNAQVNAHKYEVMFQEEARAPW